MTILMANQYLFIYFTFCIVFKKAAVLTTNLFVIFAETQPKARM